MRIIKPDLEWNGTPRFLNKDRITKLIMHHMAHPSWDFFDVHKYHRDSRGWIGIGYNYWIGFDGSIYEGRGMKVGAQAGSKWNARSVGIGFQGNFQDQEMTDEQVEAGARLCAKLIRELPAVNSVEDIVGHRDVGSTTCPGNNFRMADLRRRTAELLGGEYVVAFRRGDRGAGVKELQEWLLDLGYDMQGYGADGKYGPATEEAVKQFQIDHNLKVDGKAGPETLGKIEELLGGDDEFDTVKERLDNLEKRIDNIVDTFSEDINLLKSKDKEIEKGIDNIRDNVTDFIHETKELQPQVTQALEDTYNLFHIIEDLKVKIHKLREEAKLPPDDDESAMQLLVLFFRYLWRKILKKEEK